MQVLKFGGTSVGSAERIKRLQDIVVSNQNKIVVLSAMAGTTNSLVEITEALYNNNHEKAINEIAKLEENYNKVVKELFCSEEYIKKGNELIKSHFEYIKSFTNKCFTVYQERAILAQGELISTSLFHYYLQENCINSVLIPALNFMRIDKDGEPDYYFIEQGLRREIENHKDKKILITQGYICRDAYGEIANLKRGGSDYSAALIGSAINAEEIQIWTDIDGFHNNDPRYVEDTQSIKNLSFDEAAELAYFGAKILHPSSIQPAKQKNIPVRLKNTLNPSDEGTLITEQANGSGVKAVAAKDGITAITIKSTNMLLSYGFLRKVFEIFESWKTPIDMIATSEVAVSLTIDDTSHLNEIVRDLEKYCTVNIDDKQSIICIVGDFIAQKPGLAFKVLKALKHIPLRMISYGGSNHNISLLINESNKVEALKALNKNLLNHKK
jgi:aspartate kinase